MFAGLKVRPVTSAAKNRLCNIVVQTSSAPQLLPQIHKHPVCPRMLLTVPAAADSRVFMFYNILCHCMRPELLWCQGLKWIWRINPPIDAED